MGRALRGAARLVAIGTVLVAAGLGPVQAWSGNLLTNPGMEQGNSQWWGYAWWDQAEPYPDANAIAEDPHSGSYSLRVGPSAGGRAQSCFKPRPNAAYRIGAWGMVSQAGESGWVGIEYYDIYGNRFAPGLEFTETSYTYKELEITTPATIDTLKAYAWKNDGPGYLYVDDVSLVGPDLIDSPGTTTYYVDSAGGLDSNSGTDPLSPWQTLSKANSIVFAPGDRLLLKAGSIFYGSLDPLGSGAAGNAITIDVYGDGAKPVIDGQGLVTAPMRLYSQEYWEINNLELLNRDPGNVRERFGIWVAAEDAGTLHHLHVADCVVHDVNGLLDDSHKANGGIIFDIRGNHVETKWDDVRITGCDVSSVDRSGIWLASYWWDRTLGDTEPHHWVGSTNVVIDYNSVVDAGGDGIVPCMCIGPLVEHNFASHSNARSGRYCVAIWPWACDDAVIQYNEACFTHGTNDGQGFDSDWFSRGTIIQYNYSHDNDGGFCLVCANGTYSGFNEGTIVRYNISQNDGARSFHIVGPTSNTAIYNNTIYIGEGMAVDPIVYGNWGGFPDDTRFYNNVFYDLGTGDYYYSASTNNAFDSNLFFGNHPAGEPADPHKLTADPLFADPGGAGLGISTCTAYQIDFTSPARDSGLTIAGDGGFDFFGNPVPLGLATDLGAHEYTLPADFLDVGPGHWAYSEIMACVVAGVVQGYPGNIYLPDNTVTRAQMAVYIARALAGGEGQVPEPQGDPTFTDVADDFWAYPDIEYCADNNVVEGYPGGAYQPTWQVNRAQMAVFIARSIVTPTGEAGLEPYEAPEIPTFNDVPADYWCYEHVEYLAEHAIVEGYPDYFGPGLNAYLPTSVVDRAQMAVYIKRAFDLP